MTCHSPYHRLSFLELVATNISNIISNHQFLLSLLADWKEMHCISIRNRIQLKQIGTLKEKLHAFLFNQSM